MTHIFYGDRATRSANGLYLLNAVSPHNGTISHRDGRAPHEDEFAFKYRSHQSEFRYRLTDAASGRVIWERWQPRGEDSPGELVVSNDGWSVIRTHGFNLEVIAVRPDGRDAVRVRVEPSWGEPRQAEELFDVPTFEWVADRMSCCTAGNEWAGDSWRYFAGMNGRPFFVWRTWWGDRLVIDLEGAKLIEPSEARSRALDAAEVLGAEAFFGHVGRNLPAIRKRLARRDSDGDSEPKLDDPLRDAVVQLKAGVRVVGVHRIRSALPVLSELETLDIPSTAEGCETFQGSFWLHKQWLRLAVQQSIRQLGSEPMGFPPYYFGGLSGPRLPVTECVTNRAVRVKEIRLGRNLSPREVLDSAGTPDFIVRESRQVGRFYEGYEIWEYDTLADGGWQTTRLTWDRPQRKAEIELTAVDTLGEERVMSDARDSAIYEM